MDNVKISFFDDELEDFDELMEISQEANLPGAKRSVELPPIVPAVKDSTGETVTSKVDLEAPLVATVEKAAETKGDNPPKEIVVASTSPYLCRVCGGRHPLRFCNRFAAMSHESRLRAVIRHGYCSRCLAQSHRTKNCQSKGRCKRCNQDHHALLHSESTPPLPGKISTVRPSRKPHPYKKSSSRPCPRSETSLSDTKRNSIGSLGVLPLINVVTLAPSLVVHIKSSMSSIPVRAVIDLCSKQSQICASLVNNLGFPLSWVDGVPFCRVTLESAYDREQSLSMTARVSDLEHVYTPSESVPERIKESYEGLPLADPQFFKRGRVALVFGPELYARIISCRVQATPGLPVAQYTMFGWVLSGLCNH